MIDEGGGWVAEYQGTERMMCFGFGGTSCLARLEALRQIDGADRQMRYAMRQRIETREVGPDEASEILEMLATPW